MYMYMYIWVRQYQLIGHVSAGTCLISFWNYDWFQKKTGSACLGCKFELLTFFFLYGLCWVLLCLVMGKQFFNGSDDIIGPTLQETEQQIFKRFFQLIVPDPNTASRCSPQYSLFHSVIYCGGRDLLQVGDTAVNTGTVSFIVAFYTSGAAGAIILVVGVCVLM